MQKEIPELPEKAGFIKQTLYCIATRLRSIEEKISQPKSEQDDHSHLLKQIKELECENNKLQETLQSANREEQPKLDLERWLELQSKIQQDSELSNVFWGNSSNDPSIQFIRFIAKSGEWEQVVKVWESLAVRCKADQRPATDAELAILEGILAIHNLTSFRLQASLSSCDEGARYDYKFMERGNPTGDIVQAIWLPGLVNAGGHSVKNVLVKTQ